MRTVRSLPICFLCAVVLGCLHGLLFNISSSSSAVAQTVCPSTDLIVCDDSSSGACVQGNYSACTVLCNDTDPVSVNLLVPCQSATFRDDSTVTCGKGSCIGITGLDSAISCVEEEFDSASTTCSVGSFYRSTVSCSGYACSEAAVYHSAVTCPGSYSCSADFKYKACTCFVDGDDTFPDCRNAVDFCGSLFLGRTCHEWGNPVCQDFSIGAFTC